MPTIDEYFLSPLPLPGVRPSDRGIADCGEVEFPNENGERLHGWLLRHPAPRFTVILSHGNRGNLAGFLPWATAARDLGADVLSYDYQGFGRSGGRPQISALLGDGRSALRFVRGSDLPARDRVLLFGLSLGTVPAICTAEAFTEVRGLLLEGAFDPRVEIPRMFGPLGAGTAAVFVHQLPSDIVPDRSIRRLNMPMLFLQARADRVTSTVGARELFDAAPGPKTWREFPDCAHLEPMARRGDEYVAAMRAFVDEHFGMNGPER